MKCDFPHQLFCKHSNCFEHFPLVRLYNIEATGHKQALFSFPSPLVDHPQLASFSAPHIPLTYHSFSSLKLPRFSTVSVSNMAAFSFYYTMSVHLSGYQWLQLASWRPVCQVKRNPWALSFLVRHFWQSQWSASQRFNSFSQSSEWCSVEIVWSPSPPLSPPLPPPPLPQTAQDFILFWHNHSQLPVWMLDSSLLRNPPRWYLPVWFSKVVYSCTEWFRVVTNICKYPSGTHWYLVNQIDEHCAWIQPEMCFSSLQPSPISQYHSHPPRGQLLN